MIREQTKRGDPEYGVFEKITQWHNRMVCVPTWEEIVEVEAIRQRGEINMLTENVQRYAFDRGMYNAVNWIQRCIEAKITWQSMYSGVVQSFVDEHGPTHEWITAEMLEQFIANDLKNKERKLLEQLSEVRIRMQKRSAKP